MLPLNTNRFFTSWKKLEFQTRRTEWIGLDGYRIDHSFHSFVSFLLHIGSLSVCVPKWTAQPQSQKWVRQWTTLLRRHWRKSTTSLIASIFPLHFNYKNAIKKGLRSIVVPSSPYNTTTTAAFKCISGKIILHFFVEPPLIKIFFTEWMLFFDVVLVVGRFPPLNLIARSVHA